MVHGHEESDSAIVAAKPANKAERSAAELVEPRAETKGNADQRSTRLTQSHTQAGWSAAPACGRGRRVDAAEVTLPWIL